MDERVAARLDSPYTETRHPWGVDPDSLLVESVESFRPGSVLDLGAGDGRNALFLARRGFAVTAVDAAPLALETLDAAAASEGLIVETELADLASYEVTRSYDNVVSTLTLHFLPQQAAVSLMRGSAKGDARRRSQSDLAVHARRPRARTRQRPRLLACAGRAGA